jgi:hypothetical protein
MLKDDWLAKEIVKEPPLGRFPECMGTESPGISI